MTDHATNLAITVHSIIALDRCCLVRIGWGVRQVGLVSFERQPIADLATNLAGTTI